jgi:hypothetical protein
LWIQTKTIKHWKCFYNKLENSAIQFLDSYVAPANVNTILSDAGITGKIGLLSFDVDGNDYWVWDEINFVQPKIVVIEAKVEFVKLSIIAPFSMKNHHSFDVRYNSTAVEAFRK